MTRHTGFAVACALFLTACADGSGDLVAPGVSPAAGGVATTLEVTSASDGGNGSLRAALATASVEAGIGRIRVAPGLGTVILSAPLVYAGSQPIVLDGNGLTIDGQALPAAAPELSAALVANGGGDITLSDLAIVDAAVSGLLVNVPADRAGTQTVELIRVSITGSSLHGMLVNDQAEYFADPFGRAAAGSPASLRVHVREAQIAGNGFAGLDYDGIRINEGGAGSLDFRVAGSVIEGNGADGIELDERADGDVVFSVEHTGILANGFFSSEDFDDGIDVDELGAGHIIGAFVHAVASGNAEQGIDLNENNEGDLRVTMTDVTAEDNAEEGVEFEEDDDFEDFPAESWGGHVEALLTRVSANRNGANDGDAGLKVREKYLGDLAARIVAAAAHDNAIGGIQVREGQGGSMDAEIVSADATGNEGVGLELRGNGIARVRAYTAESNAGGDLSAEAGIELQ